MPSPYRAAPARSEGLADQDPNEKTRRVVRLVLAGIAALVVGLLSCPLCLFGAALAAEGDPGAPLFFAMAAGVPCLLAFFSVLSLPILALSKAGGADVAALEAVRAELGGTLSAPRWYDVGAFPSLRAEIDGGRARFSAHAASGGRLRHAVFALAIEEPWAKTGGSELFRSARILLSMATNHRAPYRVVCISRTALATAGAEYVGLREVPIPLPWGPRICCVTDQPERLAARLADPALVGAIAELVESNLPYLSRVSLAPEGSTWESLATSRTTGAHMAWRFRQLGALAAALAA